MPSPEERQARAMEDMSRNLKKIAGVMDSINQAIREFGKGIQKTTGVPFITIGSKVMVIDKANTHYGRVGVVRAKSPLLPYDDSALVEFVTDEAYFMRHQLDLYRETPDILAAVSPKEGEIRPFTQEQLDHNKYEWLASLDARQAADFHKWLNSGTADKFGRLEVDRTPLLNPGSRVVVIDSTDVNYGKTGTLMSYSTVPNDPPLARISFGIDPTHQKEYALNQIELFKAGE